MFRQRLLYLPLRHLRTQPPAPPLLQTASPSPLIIHHHRYRNTSSRLSKTIPSAETRRLHTDPSAGGRTIPGMEKRGWVIYRTAYAPGSDEPWARFRARVERESRAQPDHPDAPADRPQQQPQLEWVWVEDRARLDGASRERLRKEVFRGWVDGELERSRAMGVEVGPLAAEGSDDKVRFDPAAVPRYAFFVQVDEEALRSLGERGDDGWDAPGAHVKFVDAGWEPMEEEKYWDGVAEEDRFEETYDEIDGCRQENVGWMRISPYMLGGEFYDAWCGVVDVWYAFYRRPPETLNW